MILVGKAIGAVLIAGGVFLLGWCLGAGVHGARMARRERAAIAHGLRARGQGRAALAVELGEV